MKCQICGKENELNCFYCTNCGNKLLSENNYINPTRTQEVILKVVNFIFLPVITSIVSGGYTILISLIILVVFNIVMGILMNRKNKNNVYIGIYKPISKITYVLITCFFGYFGVHRFMIGDKKGGITRLIITLVIPFFLATVMSKTISAGIFIIVLSWCLLLSRSLVLSDIVIGLSKVSNENKKISL